MTSPTTAPGTVSRVTYQAEFSGKPVNSLKFLFTAPWTDASGHFALVAGQVAAYLAGHPDLRLVRLDLIGSHAPETLDPGDPGAGSAGSADLGAANARP